MNRIAICVLLSACSVATPTGGLVDETGYLDADQVFYTARMPLDTPQTLTVLGLAGALSPGGGTLISMDDATVAGPDSTGAFQVIIDAALGDVLTFEYTPPGEETGSFELVLGDGLSGADAPQTTSAELLVASPSSAGVEVVMSNLAGGAIDRIAYNATSVQAPAYSVAGATVFVDADPGEEICVFAVDGGVQSPSTCLVAP